MTTTTNLGITLIDAAVSQPSVQANAALQGIENAVTESAAISVEDGSNSVTSAVFRGGVHLALEAGSPGPSAGFDVVLPALKGFKFITNTTAYSATVSCSGADPGAPEATIAAGATAAVYNSGAGVYQAS